MAPPNLQDLIRNYPVLHTNLRFNNHIDYGNQIVPGQLNQLNPEPSRREHRLAILAHTRAVSASGCWREDGKHVRYFKETMIFMGTLANGSRVKEACTNCWLQSEGQARKPCTARPDGLAPHPPANWEQWSVPALVSPVPPPPPRRLINQQAPPPGPNWGAQTRSQPSPSQWQTNLPSMLDPPRRENRPSQQMGPNPWTSSPPRDAGMSRPSPYTSSNQQPSQRRALPSSVTSQRGQSFGDLYGASPPRRGPPPPTRQDTFADDRSSGYESPGYYDFGDGLESGGNTPMQPASPRHETRPGSGSPIARQTPSPPEIWSTPPPISPSCPVPSPREPLGRDSRSPSLPPITHRPGTTSRYAVVGHTTAVQVGPVWQPIPGQPDIGPSITGIVPYTRYPSYAPSTPARTLPPSSPRSGFVPPEVPFSPRFGSPGPASPSPRPGSVEPNWPSGLNTARGGTPAGSESGTWPFGDGNRPRTSSPLSPGSGPLPTIGSLTDMMQDASVTGSPTRRLSVSRTLPMHSRHSSVGQSAIPPHVLQESGAMAPPRSSRPAYNRPARIRNTEVGPENVDRDTDRIGFNEVLDAEDEWRAALAEYHAVEAGARWVRDKESELLRLQLEVDNSYQVYTALSARWERRRERLFQVPSRNPHFRD